jgi:hypothetical protein
MGMEFNAKKRLYCAEILNSVLYSLILMAAMIEVGI